MSRAYRDFLADIVTHAEDAIACIDGLSLDQVAADRLRHLALERCFEIIGEAAGRLAPHIRERYPAIPWAEMIAVRNRVAHAYFRLEIAILYRTARDQLPPLLPALRKARDDVVRDETVGGR